jgi:lipopolysaccharide/colanic/teichoic acid biosynthesis glycosyltransferase
VIPAALNGPRARLSARVRRASLVLRLAVFEAIGPRVRRALDVCVGGFGLLCVAPVLAVAAFAVRVESKGAVLFKQMRVGRGGAPIAIRKLRTMYPDAEARRAALEAANESKGGVTFKMKRDPRITRVGRVLRKLSIDELPQLWNLVDGTMTLLGPRPPLASEVEKYGRRARRRLEVTPGLTCFWQVQGRSNLAFEEQVELDVAYIDRATLKDDISIVARTVPAVLTGKGAY